MQIWKVGENAAKGKIFVYDCRMVIKIETFCIDNGSFFRKSFQLIAQVLKREEKVGLFE